MLPETLTAETEKRNTFEKEYLRKEEENDILLFIHPRLLRGYEFNSMVARHRTTPKILFWPVSPFR
jgi:hypothetical protein